MKIFVRYVLKNFNFFVKIAHTVNDKILQAAVQGLKNQFLWKNMKKDTNQNGRDSDSMGCHINVHQL